ncbi:unnamed protein product [Cuscuta epithymum]|uniref:Protein kinase domain-containing protein n=1 Tax=Cuscuta epithymum TaxID=186058 RepID=A0AAV0C2B6_9ASTE|nr:unnamed protein product [Cuscuta epithymum]
MRLLRLREIRLVPVSLFFFLVLVCRHFSVCWSLSDKGLIFLRSKENGYGGEIQLSSYTTDDVNYSEGNGLNMEKSRNVAANRKLMDLATHIPFIFPIRATMYYVQFVAHTASSPSPSHAPSPSPSHAPSPFPSRASSLSRVPQLAPTSALSITLSSAPTSSSHNISPKFNQVLIVSAIAGGSLLFIILLTSLLVLCHKNNIAVVKPWATGLSGQLQRAFVTGVPSLKRQELEIACEDFSNVVGASSFCTFYKGILSSGVEIAVICLTLESHKDWSRDQEMQFRKKIDMLSKVNHKNFVNLIGFCVEKKPFTRMMVFEYAPNGTLFEHLHSREVDHLDWRMRMRIIMGVAYCLEHMHQLRPPVPHQNLKSSAIHLTEDYAAKVWDLVTWDGDDSADDDVSTPETNVYSFGGILLEIVTGRQPDALNDVASEYVRGRKSLREMADPTLCSFNPEQMDGLGEVIKSCLRLSPRLRPTMREISGRLREIIGIGPDAAVPKASPLWWAELEILSAHDAF